MLTMRWFFILAIILGVYYWLIVSSTDMVINQTMQLHQQYQAAAEQTEVIAASNR